MSLHLQRCRSRWRRVWRRDGKLNGTVLDGVNVTEREKCESWDEVVAGLDARFPLKICRLRYRDVPGDAGGSEIPGRRCEGISHYICTTGNHKRLISITGKKGWSRSEWRPLQNSSCGSSFMYRLYSRKLCARPFSGRDQHLSIWTCPLTPVFMRVLVLSPPP